jgi:methyl-accepting chemotaxis protein
MSLPLILEVAIGLVFIYLTLSLLASEIQEIVGTLLQWRAEHLKRSIEVLLAGNDPESRQAAEEFANQLYDSPLIRSLNQEATGPIGRGFRLFNKTIGSLYRLLTRTRNVFGKSTSGPSYIPAPAFAQTLLENLRLDAIRNVLVDSRLRRLIEERMMLPVNHIVNDLRASTANEFLLNGEVRQLEQAIGQILQDFQERRANLAETLDRLLSRLQEFEAMAQDVLPDNHHLTETFMRRLHYLQRNIARNDLDKTALMRKLQPSLQELMQVLDTASDIYQELASLSQREGGEAKAALEYLRQQPLPPSVRASLDSMAKKVQGRVAQVEDDLSELNQAVESWFNRSMDRASGVYKRNAKAVGLIIGFAIAVGMNADSLHMIERLSTDPTIRQAITQSAQQFASDNPETLPSELSNLQTAVDDALSTVPIPLGYQTAVVQRQEAAQARWKFPIPRRILGWGITAIAISMGANFWFGLLKKLISVKASGKAPREIQRPE